MTSNTPSKEAQQIADEFDQWFSYRNQFSCTLGQDERLELAKLVDAHVARVMERLEQVYQSVAEENRKLRKLVGRCKKAIDWHDMSGTLDGFNPVAIAWCHKPRPCPLHDREDEKGETRG